MADLVRVAVLHFGALADRLPECLADLGIGAPRFARAWIESDAFALELGNRALGSQRSECLGRQFHITNAGSCLGSLDHVCDLIELYPGNGSIPIDVVPLQRLQLAWAQACLKPELEHGPFVGAAGLEDGLALRCSEWRHHIVADLGRLPDQFRQSDALERTEGDQLIIQGILK